MEHAMHRLLAVGTVCFALLTVGVTAQTPQPYAGMETRPIKALSEQQLADLRTGRGMSLALAAELNGYPGPRHVLELADQLNLSPEQLQNIKRLFAEMTAESVALGQTLITQETELDGQFARRTVSQDSLSSAIAVIGQAQTELREAHLKYHLLTTALLTQRQLHRYSQLRGYMGSSQGHLPAHGN
jgi:Spy/CpxP family protein refolding chaperone